MIECSYVTCSALTYRMSNPIKEPPEGYLAPAVIWVHSKMMVIYVQESGFLSEIKPVGALMLDFLASKIMRNKCLSHPVDATFVTVALTDQDIFPQSCYDSAEKKKIN